MGLWGCHTTQEGNVSYRWTCLCRQSTSKSHNGEAIVKILEEMDTNVVYLLQFSKTVALTDLKHEATEVNVSNYIFMHTPEGFY